MWFILHIVYGRFCSKMVELTIRNSAYRLQNLKQLLARPSQKKVTDPNLGNCMTFSIWLLATNANISRKVIMKTKNFKQSLSSIPY